MFSNYSHSMEINLEICRILFDLFFSENDMEVIAHVLNAFFDIYKEEDYNKNLIEVNVIDTMKAGVSEFGARVNFLIYFSTSNLFRSKMQEKFKILTLKLMIIVN